MSIFSGCLGLPGVSSQGMIWATCQNRGTLKMRGFILGFSLSQPPRGCPHPSNADCPTKMESFSPWKSTKAVEKTTRSTPPCPFGKQVAFSRRVKPSPGLLQICAERRVSNEGRVSIEGWGGGPNRSLPDLANSIFPANLSHFLVQCSSEPATSLTFRWRKSAEVRAP